MLDLTFRPSFKVKQWFTGFGELSFRWIQICFGSPMRRSSCLLDYWNTKIIGKIHCEISVKCFLALCTCSSSHQKLVSVTIKIQIVELILLY